MSKYKTAQPSTRTEFEKKFGESQIYRVPYEVVSALWHPDTVPAHLLPYLAWALSVDYWNEHWTEAQKRAVVKSAYRTHKIKGTNGAIAEALRPFGVSTKIIEWWQTEPPARPGTFRLNLLSENSLSQADYQEMLRIVGKVKPVSRHLSGLAVGVMTRGRLKPAAAVFYGSRTVIYPYVKPEISLQTSAGGRAAVQKINTLTIQPKESA